MIISLHFSHAKALPFPCQQYDVVHELDQLAEGRDTQVGNYTGWNGRLDTAESEIREERGGIERGGGERERRGREGGRQRKKRERERERERARDRQTDRQTETDR